MLASTIAIAGKINETSGKFLFKSLLDPGGSHVIINRRALPLNIETFESDL